VLNGAGAVRYERGWSGSGGGRSLYEPEPAFQNSWQSSGKRQMPDVSDVGDPDTGLLIYDSIPYLGSSGWSDVGGTSAGTPQWAALYALANSMRPTPLTSTNMALYDLGSPRTFATYFRDITQGCNVYFCASPGYDQVTGLGSPRANTLVPDLAGSEAQAAR
jgi:subtilase family serine protease